MNSKYRRHYWIQDRIAVRVNGPIHEFVRPPGKNGTYVMGEDWDNLIVLDACRADLFRQSIDVDVFDRYDVVESLGSCTPQWTTRNFSDAKFGDTVYVSGNAFTSLLASDQFHQVVEIEETMEDLDVVHPESIYEAAKECLHMYPDKRFIVHFVQPHMPFIATPELVFRHHGDDKPEGYGGKDDPLHVHEALACGTISLDDWWRGYRENLLLAYEYAWDLAHELGGKSVITSDHGNMAGERTWPVPIRHYGHPRGLRTPELVNVPWAVLTIGERREWIDDGVDSETGLDHDEIENRLIALGYRT